MDTNGNGKRDDYVEPNQPVDPAKDKRFGGGLYSVAPAPDGSIWGSVLGMPGAAVRLVPGLNPPQTALAEVYEPPFNDPKNPGFTPRGMDIDRQGVAWVALASGHLASFDRRKCKGPLNGPLATGQHCPEGWTLYPEPLPQMKGVTDPGSAGASYYTWVDQFDTLGPGPGHTDQYGQRRGRAARAERRQVGRPARPLPAGLLHEMDGRPRGRSRRRMEGPGDLVHRQHPRAVPHGGREGDDEQGREVPAAARPARQVRAAIISTARHVPPAETARGMAGVSQGFAVRYFNLRNNCQAVANGCITAPFACARVLRRRARAIHIRQGGGR